MNAHDPWSIFADAEPEPSAALEQAPSHDPWAAFADAPPQQQAEAQPQESDAYNTALAPFRGFNKGLADMVSAPYRAIDWAQEQTVGRFTGDLMPDVEDMDMWKYYREPEKAKTTAGHYLQSAGEAVGASAVPAMGLAAAAPKMAAMTANTLPRAVGQAFGESVAKAPATAAMADLTGAATSGAATQYAADEGYGPGVQTMAGLAGGMAPFAAYGAGKAAIKIPQTMRDAPSDSLNAVRAQQMTQDMKALGIEPFGPAVASARRGDNSAGATAQYLMDKPYVGTPLQEGRQEMLDGMSVAARRLSDDFGNTMDHAQLGANIRDTLDYVKTGNHIDPTNMTDDELIRMAAAKIRDGTPLPDIQTARYEMADRSLPKGKLRGGKVKGEESLAGGLPATKAVLARIKSDHGIKINKQEAIRDADGLPPELTAMGGFKNPAWTKSSIINQSLDAVISAGGRWNTGIQGMRGIRSDLRRAESLISDKEAYAVTHGNIKQLHGAVSRDFHDSFENAAQRATALGRNDAARAYRDSATAYRYADDLTREYKGYLDDVKGGISNLRKDESVAAGVIGAMKTGQKGNIKALRGLVKVLPEKGLDEIASTVIAEIGRPKGPASGALKEAGFSPSQFAKNWYEMTDEAKKIFFSRRPRQRMMLDKLARVAQASKDYEMLANKSRTGASNMITATLGGGGLIAGFGTFSGAMSIAATMLAGNAAARYLASPTYVSWLSRSLDLPPVKFARALKQLRGIALKDRKIGPKERQALLTLIRQVGGSNDREGWQKPPRGGQPWRRR